jgi:hypothetical protein
VQSKPTILRVKLGSFITAGEILSNRVHDKDMTIKSVKKIAGHKA